jgi:hypothetical protein
VYRLHDVFWSQQQAASLTNTSLSVWQWKKRKRHSTPPSLPFTSFFKILF